MRERERGQLTERVTGMTTEHVETPPGPRPCPSSLTVHPLRLEPGAELRSSLLSYVQDNRLEAPFIITCCGSLTKATLRLASHTPADGQNKVSKVT